MELDIGMISSMEWLSQFANWKMAIEIVSFPIKNGDFPYITLYSLPNILRMISAWTKKNLTEIHGSWAIHGF